MDYEKILHMLPDYAAGRLEPREREEVRAALEKDPALERQLDAYRAYHDAVGKLEEVRVPGDFVDKVNRRIDERRGLRGLLHTLFVPVFPKLPLEVLGLGLTVALVIMLFNPFTLKNVPREVLEEAPAAARSNSVPVMPDTGVSADEEGMAAGGVDALRKAPAAPEGREPRQAPEEGGRAPEERKERDARGPSLTTSNRVEHLLDHDKAQNVQKQERYAVGPKAKKRARGTARAAAPAPSPPPAEAKPRTSETEQAEAAPESPPAPVSSAATKPAGDDESKDALSEQQRAADVALERRKLRASTEAVSVMTLTVDERDIDSDGVARRWGRGNDDARYSSVADKVYHLVERAIEKHGGSYTIRSTVTSLKQQRVYVVAAPRSAFEPLRAAFAKLGALKDIDLNLDLAGAERITFRLAVRVED